MTAWSLVYEDFDPGSEGTRETLCTLGNGYFATRGAGEEACADDVHYPGTYVAGVYNRLQTEVAGRVVENEDLVNVPNWLPLTFRIEKGPWFSLRGADIVAYRQELDLKRGILLRTVRFRDREGRETSLHSRRLLHMYQPHLAALEVTLAAENWSGTVQVRSALDGRVLNTGVERYRDLNHTHLQTLEADTVDEETIHLRAQTTQSEIRIAEAARTRVFSEGEPAPLRSRHTVREDGYIADEIEIDLAQGRPVTVEKVVALYTSRDRAISECGLDARAAVAAGGSFGDLLRSHTQAWANLWSRVDVGVLAEPASATEEVARTVRLNVFHVLQTVSMNSIDLDTGVPARGLHGEAYRGHIFWDEMFIFPFLNVRVSEITRALLMYRYRRLAAARAAADAEGYRGAMFPWQSSSNGREESQSLHLNPRSGRWLPDHTRLQRHVSSAIAYNVWNYFQATGDIEFLSFFGAEMLLEIARFWSSVATLARDGRYDIRGVMGPDEYHDRYPDREEAGLDNNAYTNLMAVWVLCRALELLDLLPEDRRKELTGKLGITEAETDLWDKVSRKMRVAFHGDGIISQFEGYDRLKEFDWKGYRRRYGDIQRLDRILEAEGDSPNGYQASKQADVLMLFYLFSAEELEALFERLGYPFDPTWIPRNIQYYLERTSHGSTLSRVVHSWVLARSDSKRSWELFVEALKSDLTDIQGGTTSEGIHLGAVAGTVDILQRGYTGIEMRGDTLWFNPSLPEDHFTLSLHLRFQGHSMQVEIAPGTLRLHSLRCAGPSLKVGVRGRVHELASGDEREFEI